MSDSIYLVSKRWGLNKPAGSMLTHLKGVVKILSIIAYYYQLLLKKGLWVRHGTHSSAQASQTLWEGGICRIWSIKCGPLMSPQSFPGVPWYTSSALAGTPNSCWHGGVTAWWGLVAVAVLTWVPWRLSPGLRAQHTKHGARGQFH